ncbi:hypothetical protein [Serratia fonticola]
MTKSTVTNEQLREIAEKFESSPNNTTTRLMAETARELLAVREAQSVPAPIAFSENADADMCRAWAWEQVKKDLAPEGWSIGDSCNFYGFYCWGWDMRRQYNEQRPPAVPGELIDAMAEVIRISDRDHEAWDRAKAAISACQPDGEKCWSCGKYFTYVQHSECDGYCPHCNAPVDLEDDEGQPSQVVPVEPTEEMVANAWRETLGKCDHETIKRMYATMLAAAPTPTKAVPCGSVCATLNVDRKTYGKAFRVVENDDDQD